MGKSKVKGPSSMISMEEWRGAGPPQNAFDACHKWHRQCMLK